MHVDFWVFGFNIDFGPKASSNKAPLRLTEFWKLVMQAETTPRSTERKVIAASDSDSDDKAAHMLTCQQGLLADSAGQDVKATDPWSVRSVILEFSITAYFAVYAIKVNGKTLKSPEGLDKIYVRPMQLTQPVNSELGVSIKGPDKKPRLGWAFTPEVRSVPQGLWGICKFRSLRVPIRPNSLFF